MGGNSPSGAEVGFFTEFEGPGCRSGSGAHDTFFLLLSASSGVLSAIELRLWP